MYQAFFGLREQPFGLTPDTSYYFRYSAHQEALDTLKVALDMGEGFIKVVGEVGTGKTLVCRKLLNELSQHEGFVTAYIPNPPQTPAALKRALADELGVRHYPSMGQHELMAAINNVLINNRSEGRMTVLMLDEAQALPEECLEAVRLFTNLETEKNKLLSVVLFGQPELDIKLARPSIRQLKQRISFTYQLSPMSPTAVHAYLHHRMVVAGYQGEALFSPAVAKLLHKLSGGIPRLINILAHKALLVAYGEGCQVIKKQYVKRASDDTESIQKKSLLGFRWLPFGLAGLTSVVIAGWFAQGGGL